MTFEANRIGDKGERYEVRYLEYGDAGVCRYRTLAWTDHGAHADVMAHRWSQRRSVSQAWVCDRGTVQIFEDLKKRVEAEVGEDLPLDSEVYWRFVVLQGDRAREIDFSARVEKPVDWRLFERLPQSEWCFTSSIAAARSLVGAVFPDWRIASGFCNSNAYANIGPDYDGPARERLLVEFPIKWFDAGFECDRYPGGEIGSECRAIVSCVLQAQIAVLRERQESFSCPEVCENG